MLDHPIFTGVESPSTFTRYHSWAVNWNDFEERKDVAIIAHVDEEVMALSTSDNSLIGIQFHPESILSREGPKIIKNFLAM